MDICLICVHHRVIRQQNIWLPPTPRNISMGPEKEQDKENTLGGKDSSYARRA